MALREAFVMLGKMGPTVPLAPRSLVPLFAAQELFERRQAGLFGQNPGFDLQLSWLLLLLSVARHIMAVIDGLRTLEWVFRHELFLLAQGRFPRGQANETGAPTGTWI